MRRRENNIYIQIIQELIRCIHEDTTTSHYQTRSVKCTRWENSPSIVTQVRWTHHRWETVYPSWCAETKHVLISISHHAAEALEYICQWLAAYALLGSGAVEVGDYAPDVGAEALRCYYLWYPRWRKRYPAQFEGGRKMLEQKQPSANGWMCCFHGAFHWSHSRYHVVGQLKLQGLAMKRTRHQPAESP